jgi:molybdopterin converting factor small subunit
MIRVRVFAAGAEACGTSELDVAAPTVAALREYLGSLGPHAARVIAQCAILRSGERLEDAEQLAPGDLVDVLPPFAGG